VVEDGKVFILEHAELRKLMDRVRAFSEAFWSLVTPELTDNGIEQQIRNVIGVLGFAAWRT